MLKLWRSEDKVLLDMIKLRRKRRFGFNFLSGDSFNKGKERQDGIESCSISPSLLSFGCWQEDGLLPIVLHKDAEGERK